MGAAYRKASLVLLARSKNGLQTSSVPLEKLLPVGSLTHDHLLQPGPHVRTLPEAERLMLALRAAALESEEDH